LVNPEYSFLRDFTSSDHFRACGMQEGIDLTTDHRKRKISRRSAAKQAKPGEANFRLDRFVALSESSRLASERKGIAPWP
jgi:hypothetical protein